MWLHLEILKEKSIAIGAQVEVENIWNSEIFFKENNKKYLSYGLLKNKVNSNDSKAHVIFWLDLSRDMLHK
jgi:hypothetical protein